MSWIDVEYAINAEISIDNDTYTALISPYCSEKVAAGPGGKNLIPYPYASFETTKNGLTATVNSDRSITINGTATNNTLFIYAVNSEYNIPAGTYTLSGCPSGGSSTTYCQVLGDSNYNDTGDGVTRTYVSDVKQNVFIKVFSGYTATNLTFKPQLELGETATEYEEYYEKYEEGSLIENVTLAVYRREYDGTYKEIASGIPNTNTAITDPHPSLDYARYRLVAKDTLTGAISFYDMPGYPVKGTAILVQWDEEWSTFDVNDENPVEGPPWTGSILKLPYNIKVTDRRKKEVSFAEYIGREHKVSYYGTQTDESPSWSVSIPKEDKDTIYALRRLSIWAGDAYVREPSGMGYWANINVSFDQEYNSVTIPVTLDITRVEGGV